MESEKSHDEQVVRWAKFVRDNPDKWKPQLNSFIDAQFEIALRFYKNLAKTEGGMETLKRIREARVERKGLNRT
jgi:hypothetical protein